MSTEPRKSNNNSSPIQVILISSQLIIVILIGCLVTRTSCVFSLCCHLCFTSQYVVHTLLSSACKMNEPAFHGPLSPPRSPGLDHNTLRPSTLFVRFLARDEDEISGHEMERSVTKACLLRRIRIFHLVHFNYERGLDPEDRITPHISNIASPLMFKKIQTHL